MRFEKHFFSFVYCKSFFRHAPARFYQFDPSCFQFFCSIRKLPYSSNATFGYDAGIKSGHRFSKQITKLEVYEAEQHVVVTGNTTRLKWRGRTSFCMYNEWKSF